MAKETNDRPWCFLASPSPSFGTVLRSEAEKEREWRCPTKSGQQKQQKVSREEGACSLRALLPESLRRGSLHDRPDAESVGGARSVPAGKEGLVCVHCLRKVSGEDAGGLLSLFGVVFENVEGVFAIIIAIGEIIRLSPHAPEEGNFSRHCVDRMG